MIDYHDKIIYYDRTGAIIDELRLLNANHPHHYFNIRNNVDKTIKLGDENYVVLLSSIDYTHHAFGTTQITHLHLLPFTDGQTY